MGMDPYTRVETEVRTTHTPVFHCITCGAELERFRCPVCGNGYCVTMDTIRSCIEDDITYKVQLSWHVPGGADKKRLIRTNEEVYQEVFRKFKERAEQEDGE